MKKMLFMIIALFAICVSCDEFDIIVPFSVISVSPSDNESNVDLETSIIIKFNKTISSEQNDCAGIVLLNSSGDEIKTTKEIDKSNLSIIVKPIDDLKGSTKYELKVANILSEDGKISKSFSSSFQTKQVPVKLASCSMIDGTVDVEKLSKIVLNFDREIQKTLYNYNAINLVDSKSIPVVGVDKIVSDNTKSVTIEFPEYLLDPGESYKITVKSVKAEDGSIISNPDINFTVKDEPFGIVSISPSNGSNDVALDSKIIVVFNKKIEGHGLPYFTVQGKCGETWTTTTDKFKTVTFTCDTLLSTGIVYSLVEFGNTISVDGEILGNLPEYSFTVIPL